MFSLIFGEVSPHRRVIALIAASLTAAVLMWVANSPWVVHFGRHAQYLYLAPILIGVIIGWPFHLIGYRKWIALFLAATLALGALVALIQDQHGIGTVLCLLAQLEWVAFNRNPKHTLRSMLEQWRSRRGGGTMSE